MESDTNAIRIKNLVKKCHYHNIKKKTKRVYDVEKPKSGRRLHFGNIVLKRFNLDLTGAEYNNIVPVSSMPSANKMSGKKIILIYTPRALTLYTN